MLASVGDLVDDIIVRLGAPMVIAADTTATIDRRRGGSAANVVAAAARLGHPSRFLGQVGDDAVGRVLVESLANAGVGVEYVRREGRTGTIVVLVDDVGERTMLTDRRACVGLSSPEADWLRGVDALHVPFYSFTGSPLRETTQTLISWSHDRGIAVSIDVSSTSLLDRLGREAARDFLAELAPTVVFANADEAVTLGIDGPLGDAITVVKQGPDPVIVHRPGNDSAEVPAQVLDHTNDTTGAGDVFAAGFLSTDGWRDDPVPACEAGHRAAAAMLAGR